MKTTNLKLLYVLLVASIISNYQIQAQSNSYPQIFDFNYANFVTASVGKDVDKPRLSLPGPVQSAAKAGMDEAALAAQKKAAQAVALANVEMRSQAKASVCEAMLAAQVKATEAAALANVELHDQTKAGVNEAAVAAQLRADEAAALSNREMRSQAKAGDETAVAAQLKAAQAAALANVELHDQTKAGVDEAAVAARLRAGEAATQPDPKTPAPTKAGVDEAALAAATRAEEAAAAKNTSQIAGVAEIAPGVVRAAPAAIRPSDTVSAVTRRAAALDAGLGSAKCQQQVKLPALTAERLNYLKRADTSPDKGPFQIGDVRPLDPPIIVSGATAPASAWTVLPNGWRVWRIDVVSEGALGVRVHLESVHLPQGVQIIAYSPTNSAAEATAITVQSLYGETDTWTEMVFSDHVVVECQVPPEADLSAVSFMATGLSHLYVELFPQVNTKAAEFCENDVTCFPAWAGEASGVARITFIQGGGQYLCTGCLLNTVPTTFIDYFLTANHCIGDQTTASTLEAYWFYQTIQKRINNAT